MPESFQNKVQHLIDKLEIHPLNKWSNPNTKLSSDLWGGLFIGEFEGDHYLIDTQGYEYARYATKLNKSSGVSEKDDSKKKDKSSVEDEYFEMPLSNVEKAKAKEFQKLSLHEVQLRTRNPQHWGDTITIAARAELNRRERIYTKMSGDERSKSPEDYYYTRRIKK